MPRMPRRKLKQVLPRLDLAETEERLKRDKKFIYLAREITPREEQAINNLGIPGVDFRPTQHRQYPLGRTAAQVLGGVDVEQSRLCRGREVFRRAPAHQTDPLRLSIDLQVQAAVREELMTAMQTFEAIGGCGIVMDVHTGEVLAMVSLPDYDANAVRTAPAEDRFNRAVEGTYEPGSTFKLQTASMALDSGVAHIWDEFDASHNISIGRFTISDFEGKHRWLYPARGAGLLVQPGRGAYRPGGRIGASAELAQEHGHVRPHRHRTAGSRAAAHPAGGELERDRHHDSRLRPWHFGYAAACRARHGGRSPTAACWCGRRSWRRTPASQPDEVRVMQPSTSDIMRRLMRLVVTDGFGKSAEVPGYYPGGKTGTAEKVAAHGGYKKHANVAAFMSVFPMNAPRYAVYMMLDEPHGNKNTYGYATAGWVVAPAAGKVIARIGPMLGMLPDIQNMPAINQALAIPLQPPPGGALARAPGQRAPAATADAAGCQCAPQSTTMSWRTSPRMTGACQQSAWHPIIPA